VIYDGGPSIAAARAWWVLRWAGIEDVRVLDGGFAAWLAAGQPTQSAVDIPTPGTADVRPGSVDSLNAEQAGRWAADGRLVDVRAPERFRGEVEPMDPVAGRIPGALNLPTTANVDATGRFLPLAELRDRFAGLPDQPIGVYCGSGVTAAHTVLAMRLAGLDAVLYPGSWSEWITDPQRPVATG
jgi:thiosulfate/3-mercaptopyruvate sulfurtransferase